MCVVCVVCLSVCVVCVSVCGVCEGVYKELGEGLVIKQNVI